jgi:hypothetical protein
VALVAGDDDNYIQLAHLEADLRLVSQLVPATGMTRGLRGTSSDDLSRRCRSARGVTRRMLVIHKPGRGRASSGGACG